MSDSGSSAASFMVWTGVFLAGVMIGILCVKGGLF